MSNINYQDPLKEDVYFQEYLKSKGEILKKKNAVPRPQSSHMWALVFVLMVSLVGLGVTALLQFRSTQALVAKYEGAGVAGVNETTEIQNIITAEGFSIILREQTPKEYVVTRESSDSVYLVGLKGVTTSLKAEISKDEKKLTTGIEVQVVEYNNSLTTEQFAEKVLEKLGPNYTKISSQIDLPKDYNATSIKNTSPTTEGIDYYTVVTSSNYYVIKVYNQTSPNPDLASFTRFTDSLLTNIYLN